MVEKEYVYRGKKFSELLEMQHSELANILPARVRRSLKRGLTEGQKKLLAKIKLVKQGKKKQARTHARDMFVLPEMAGVRISIHDGKTYVPIEIRPEMVGHYLGEFVRTRRDVEHKAPGVGATRSTKHISVK